MSHSALVLGSGCNCDIVRAEAWLEELCFLFQWDESKSLPPRHDSLLFRLVNTHDHSLLKHFYNLPTNAETIPIKLTAEDVVGLQ